MAKTQFLSKLDISKKHGKSFKNSNAQSNVSGSNDYSMCNPSSGRNLNYQKYFVLKSNRHVILDISENTQFTQFVLNFVKVSDWLGIAVELRVQFYRKKY